MAALSFPTNVDFERNQLIRAALELVAAFDTTPVAGQFQLLNASHATLPWRMGYWDSTAWRILGSINKLEEVTGFWTFNPATKADGSTAAAPGDPPFGVSVNRTGRVANLNADLLDGWGAVVTSPTVPPNGLAAPTGPAVPVYSATGQLAVADPQNDYDAVNKKTLTAAQQGITYTTPVRLASTARLNGSRATNTITSTIPEKLTVDGVDVVVNDRVLVKDQQTGGTAIDNGIYKVTAAGAAGTQLWVLLRDTDADTTTELKVNLTTFVTAGTTNINAQFTCTAAGTLNTDPNTWTLISKVAGYTGYRGIAVVGTQINFAKDSHYTTGGVFYASSQTGIAEILPPAADGGTKQWFFNHAGGTGNIPTWAEVEWAKIKGKPANVALGSGTDKRHSRWTATANTLENAYLIDDVTNDATSGGIVKGSASTIHLGDQANPFVSVHTKSARVLPIASTGNLLNLVGFNTAVEDTGTPQKEIRTFTQTQVNQWLGLADIDTRFALSTTKLTIQGTIGAVTVSAPNQQTLEADRVWTITLDFATLDTRWVTRTTAQFITGQKVFEAVDGATVMTAWRNTTQTEYPLSITAGGTIKFGNGVAAPIGLLGFDDATTRIAFSGRPVWFNTGSTVVISTALASSGAPTTVLGLDGSSTVRQVSAADLATYLGSPWTTQPLLANMAVGYGDATGRLTGNASTLKWDHVNLRLGVNVASPTTALDMSGILKLSNVITGGFISGIDLAVTDTSTLTADWTGRTLVGVSFVISKTGSAVHSGTSSLEAFRSHANFSNGTLSYFFGIRSLATFGHNVNAPAANSYYGFYSQPVSALGALGTLALFAHYTCSDTPANWVTPAEKYGLYFPNHLSPAGSVRVAALRLDMNASGAGERYNIYANGAAPNYFGGNVGIGVFPTARLDLGAQYNLLAPLRFQSAGAMQGYQALLTTLLPGAVETDLTTVNLRSRVYYTDGVPTRRTFAFLDDCTFTNDPNAMMAGCVNFNSTMTMTSEVHFAISNLDGQVFTGDATVSCRFRFPVVFPVGQNSGVWSLTSSTNGGSGPNDWGLYIHASGLAFFIRNAAGSLSRTFSIGLVDLLKYTGRIVDFVVVRASGVISVYINGFYVPTANAGAVEEDKPIAGGAATLRFHVGNIHTATYCLQERIYSARVYNRALTAVEIANEARQGVDEPDKWASTVPYLTQSWATADGWITSGGVQTAGQAIGGKTNVLKVVANTNPTCITYKPDTLTRRKRSRAEGNYYIPAASPVCDRCAVGFFNQTSTKISLPAPTYDTWTSFLHDSLPDVNISGSNSAFEMDMANAAGVINPGFTAADTIYYEGLKLTRIGCVVDLDFAKVVGTTVHDWSGRFPANIGDINTPAVKALVEIVRPFHSANSSSGGSGVTGGVEVATGLRKYTKRISIAAAGTINIDHNLGTYNVTVEVWWDDTNASPLPSQKVEAYIETPTIDRVTVMVSNMKVTPRVLRIVVIG